MVLAGLAHRARSLVTLARWLGPWADPTAAPTAIARDAKIERTSQPPVHIRIYTPHRRPPTATFLIAPGLHFAGADDPRMDRFCRVLAAAGHRVVAPFIPDFLALTPNAAAKRDFIASFDALARWMRPGERPVVFSISFGSLLAFALAAERGPAVARLVIFGGYADLAETLRFCLTGVVASGRRAVRDPLNQPVVLLNLLELIPCADRPALASHWRRYVERTWGRPELKVDNRHVAIAHHLAREVPAAIRELFLIGVGALPGADQVASAALAHFDGSELDPTRYLPHVRGRVDLVHGADDDVIPWEHAPRLAAALTAADPRVHITGAYGHTGAARPAVADFARELPIMVRVLATLTA